jgi:predicted dehydrogenase
MSRVRVGVVGVGSLGFHHARILSGLPEVEFAGA